MNPQSVVAHFCRGLNRPIQCRGKSEVAPEEPAAGDRASSHVTARNAISFGQMKTRTHTFGAEIEPFRCARPRKTALSRLTSQRAREAIQQHDMNHSARLSPLHTQATYRSITAQSREQLILDTATCLSVRPQ